MLRRMRQAALGLLLVVAATVVFIAIDQIELPFDREFDESTDARQISAHPNFARVIDADTIVVGDVHIRLDGIAAPERGHNAYTKGKWFIEDLLQKAELVECNLEGRKSHDREIGACIFLMADGSSIDPQGAKLESGVSLI